MFHMHKKAYFSHLVHTCVYIHVSENFSFAMTIHGISRSLLNSMMITQVHLVLGTIKGHSKMCSFDKLHNATDVSSY